MIRFHQNLDDSSFCPDRGPPGLGTRQITPFVSKHFLRRLRRRYQKALIEDNSKNLQLWLEPIFKRKRMKIHDVHVELLGYDPFGAVKSCSLKVKAIFKEGIFEVSHEQDRVYFL